MKKIADLLLHPVRMSIIQALVKRNLTVQELMEWLPDIPQATLYRHLNTLKDNDIIIIVDEKKVRGAYERTYSLHPKKTHLSAEELNSVDKEDHLQFFITYMTNLISSTEAYLESEEIQMEKDGFGYTQVDLYLNDEELLAFQQEVGTVLQKYIKNEPATNRRKRTLATVLIPEKKGRQNE
ncbi:helix-turn-helix domain-containing protein [Bacillus sp. FJAT-45350]|uniref:helix-turn-helix domain-containing protein n=1 Tax=Bacillus sp. FJAT-45350 TaxID=2011014 RepID=UPI0015C8FA5E|nr:helix-turn-helix domain-containing protein [Bacillus sp. FJAT-45350]